MAEIVNFRHMRESDVDQVLKIEQSANRFPWTHNNFSSCFKQGYSNWVAENKQQQILAFSLTQQIVDELHLLNICVSPSFQRQGYGKLMLNHVVDFAEEHSASIILLEVRRSNHRAIQLYSQTGFNEISVRRAYYPSDDGREDAILMAKDLAFVNLFS